MDKSYSKNINSLEFKNVSHAFKQGETSINVLDKISLKITKGSIIGLLGASGSGKSTLLHLAGLLEKPISGNIIIENSNTSKINDKERTLIRKKNIGFVFQKSHLLPEFSAIENIFIAQKIIGKNNSESLDNAKKILEDIKLDHRAYHRPSKLSGGEQQRVAIARALINNPSLLLADEPTGNLDSKSAKTVIDILIKNIKLSGASALIATHSSDLARKMDKTYRLVNGKISDIS